MAVLLLVFFFEDLDYTGQKAISDEDTGIMQVSSTLPWHDDVTTMARVSSWRFKNAYELLNLRVLKMSML